MEGTHDRPEEAVAAAQRLLDETDRECDRIELVERVVAAGFDRETARRAVQRLALDDETTLTTDRVRSP